MQVSDIVLKCAAFIGHPAAHGSFVVDGTAFFGYVTEEEQDFHYIITCTHVVWPERAELPKEYSGSPSGKISLRVNLENGEPKVFESDRSEWVFHKDKWVDICAFAVDARRSEEADKVDWAPINLGTLCVTPENASQYGLSLGDEIFMTGAFVGRIGERKNIPVVRIGNIAAMPSEPVDNAAPRAPAYLIEIRSLGGFSGSPVFLNLQSSRHNRRLIFGPVKIIPQDGSEEKEVVLVPYRLIGMMLASHRGKHPGDFISEGETDIRIPGDAEFNAGIGVVMPAEQIVRFLMDTPALKEGRAASLKAKKAGYRAVPASVVESAPSTKPDNPTHKEDFTRLLGAATAKRQSDDQT
jgi:hypothetical protein